MQVEYIYDAETKVLIDKWRGYLSDYEKMLMSKINSHARLSHLSGIDVESSKRHAFLNDPDRITLEAQLAKVYALAIPVNVIFSEKGNAA